MKRLIEIFDDALEDNIYASIIFQVEEVIFFVDEKKDLILQLKNTEEFLKRKVKGIKVSFVSTDFSKILKITEDIEQLFVDDTCVEITGGEDRIKVPLMKYALEHHHQCCYFDIDHEKVIFLNSHEDDADITVEKLNLAQILYLSGATAYAGGYENLRPEEIRFIDDIIQIAFEDMERWKKFCFFSSYAASHYLKKDGFVRAPVRIKAGNKHYKLDEEMIRKLADIGVIKNLVIKDGNCAYRYYNASIKELLTTQGDALEVYTYLRLLDSKEFDEVEISTVIDWDQRNDDSHKILNEIDVIARKKQTLYFISCKTGSIKAEFLNEIVLISKKFGLKETVPVIITSEDIDIHNSQSYDRALKLGCVICDIDCIRDDRLIDALLNKRSYCETIL